MLNFLYDLTATQPTPDSKFHGAGTYGEIVFLKLLQIFDAQKVAFFVAYDSKRYINEELINAADKLNLTFIDIQKESPKEICSKYKIDRFYSALLDESIPWEFANAQVITTVHGLRGLEMPLDRIALNYDKSVKTKIKDFLKLYIFNKRQIAKIYKGYKRFFVNDYKIITVSNHSKASIISFFPKVKDEDIKVFSSPTFDQLKDDSVLEIPLLKINNITAKKYFILTSGARWIKNNMRAIFAFDDLFMKNDQLLKDFKVVITGVPDKAVFTRYIKNKDKFVFFDYVERDLLASLEANAYAFVYPSLNEGFGYPPVEAMKYGVPVAASGTSSIPEICGDAALYFDPYSISEIKNRIIQLCNTELYNNWVEKAKAQYNKVSMMQKKDLDSMAEYLLEIK